VQMWPKRFGTPDSSSPDGHKISVWQGAWRRAVVLFHCRAHDHAVYDRMKITTMLNGSHPGWSRKQHLSTISNFRRAQRLNMPCWGPL